MRLPLNEHYPATDIALLHEEENKMFEAMRQGILVDGEPYYGHVAHVKNALRKMGHWPPHFEPTWWWMAHAKLCLHAALRAKEKERERQQRRADDTDA